MKKTFHITLQALLFAFACLLPCGCRTGSVLQPQAYLAYLANPDHGLVKEHTVAGIRYRVKYLPTDYLAFNQTDKSGHTSAVLKDSLRRNFEHSLTFLLNIGPSEAESPDITRLGVSDYQQFADRLGEMAFYAQEWLSLTADGEALTPSITRMENINALEKSRNFIVVFSSEAGNDKDLRKKDLCLSYSDELFHTGTTKFLFKKTDLQALPVLEF
jgi:hypothetical protein